ncbi:MAG: hypothetical protein K8T90_17750 [Planctomycetes bacterium]|nr:hypothetical protein [Planctomycetota bacterium]
MTNDPARPDPGLGRRFVVAVIVVLVGLVAWAFIPPSDAPLREKIEELRAAGFAVTIRDAIGPDPPESENGWAEFAAAVEAAKVAVGSRAGQNGFGPWDNDFVEEDGGDPWWVAYPPEKREKLAVYVAKLASFLEGVETALAKPHLAPPLVLDTWDMPDGAHVSVLQAASKDLSVLAYGAVSTDVRRRAALAQIAIGDRLRRVVLIDEMVAAVIASGGRDALRVGVTSGAFDAATLRGRADAVLRRGWLTEWPSTIRLEIAYQAGWSQKLVAGVTLPAEWGTQPTIGYRAKRTAERLQAALRGKRLAKEMYELTPSDFALVLDVHSVCAAAAPEPYAAYRGAVQGRLDDMDEARLGMFSFISGHIPRRLARHEAEARLARIALAVKSRRETSGAWPASLDAIRDMFPDGLPVEPYLGRPYAYEVGETTVRVALPDDAADEWARTKSGDPIKAWEFPK